MTKQDYIKFAEEHKYKIDSGLSKADYRYQMVTKAKKKFNYKTPMKDIIFMLDALEISFEKGLHKNQLLQGLMAFDMDKGLKNHANNFLVQDGSAKKAPAKKKAVAKKTPAKKAVAKKAPAKKVVEKVVIKEEKVVSKEREAVISVKDLSISFRNSVNRKQIVEVIRGISFKAYRGEILGFIGESGSGKSVTAKSLFGMNTNSITKAAELNIAGIEMSKEDGTVTSKNSDWRKIRGRKVSYIPQNPMTSLNPTMKISAQLLEVMNLTSRYKDYTEEDKKTEIIDLLEKFGIADAENRINLYPHEFSGGMRQRVVIAMSVISRPDVIIADEPTTALDPTIQASVLSLFKDIAIEYNVAIIFVSHDISVISTLSDYVNVFYAGRIIEKAPKYEMFTNSQHPYTWALLSSMPESNDGKSDLYTLDGTPPNFMSLPTGDPFSVRNKYAMEIDFKEEPPLFKVPKSKHHYAATWLLHPEAPTVKKPKQVYKIASEVRKDFKNEK